MLRDDLPGTDRSARGGRAPGPPARGSARGAALVLAAALLGAAATPALPPPPPPPSNADVKAEMLFNIAKFVEWPPGASRGQLTFTILGEDELAAVLASTLSTRTINGRRVFVRFVRRVSDAREGQILFIAASEAPRIPEVLETLRGASVLTVADVPGFASAGGMVDFVQDTDRVRFEINVGNAERAQLRISARLLALARIVPTP